MEEGQTATDPQTGEVFTLQREGGIDVAAAVGSAVYLLAVMAFLWWLLFDVWAGRCSLCGQVGRDATRSPVFRLIAYAAIGGGLGGVVNGLRSLITWHAERRAFGWRFIWRYVALPPLGSTLALMVYAVLRGTVTAVSGNPSATDSNTVPALAAFASGALAGYGSHRVFIWLDEQVAKMFAVSGDGSINVPSLAGLSQAQAEEALERAELALGTVGYRDEPDAAKTDTIVAQDPAAGGKVASGTSINVTIARRPKAAGGPAPAGDVTLKTAPGSDVLGRAVQLVSTAQTALAFVDRLAQTNPAIAPQRDAVRDKVAAVVGDVDKMKASIRDALGAVHEAEAKGDAAGQAQAATGLTGAVKSAGEQLAALQSIVDEISASQHDAAEHAAEG